MTVPLKLTGEQTISPDKLERDFNLVEIGQFAVWSVSSCKAGFGVDKLRDDCIDTYWQSDGQQPHYINISLPRKFAISHICLNVNVKMDESYTPEKLSIRAGTSFLDLYEVEAVELTEPVGWVVIPLKGNLRLSASASAAAHARQQQQQPASLTASSADWEATAAGSLDAITNPLRAFVVQLTVLSNHQNGRDTHVRQVHLYSPATSRDELANLTAFTSPEMIQANYIR